MENHREGMVAAMEKPASDPLDGLVVKVLIVDLSYSFGGATSRVLTLMQHMHHDRIALAALDNSPIAQAAQRSNLQVFIVGKRKIAPQILFKLIMLIRKEGFQVLDTQNPQSKFWGSFAAFFTGTALVSTLNSWYGNEHGRRNPRRYFYSLLELGTNFALTRYVVVSKAIYDALVSHRISPDKIDLIYNAVDIDADKIVGDKESLLQQFELLPAAVLLVSVGRLTWAKGYEDLVEAIRIIADELRDVYCLIAGDGELYQELAAQIERSGLSRRMFLLGYLDRDQVLSLLKGGDIFVMSSRTEGTPIALLEAASFKKPILATCVGGIPELISNGVEGILVPAGSPDELAQGIKKMVMDKALSDRLARGAYHRVNRDFTINQQIKATSQTYTRAWLGVSAS